MSGFDYRAEYQDYWSREDRWGSSSFTDVQDLASRVLKVGGGGSVLDVGCGMGELVHTLLRLGIDAKGTDIGERCVDEGNRRAPGRFKVGSVLKLPFADSSFDIVVCTDMLEHIDECDVPQALAELVRVSRSALFVCVATLEDRDSRWHLTIKPREWWEQQFANCAIRKHPRAQSVLEYAAIDREHDSGHATLVFETIPAQIIKQYPSADVQHDGVLHTDMLRETGRRADACVARYQLASRFVRPNDRVLDVSSGLGYGSSVLWTNAHPERITGVDLSKFAVDYANANYALSADEEHLIKFVVGDAQDLSEIEDASIDLVVSFETLEHLPDPEALIAEANRVLTPGGRFIASVPNDWTDETGKDPNPEHLHVYRWDTLAKQVAKRFLVESAYSQVAGGGMKLTDKKRSVKRWDVTPNGDGLGGKAEWWLVVAMKDPVGASTSADANRHFPVHDYKGFNVTNFARDYDNPWLVRSMVSIGLRAESEAVLSSIAQRTLKSARSGSPDQGAALCVIGYQHLQSAASTKKLESFLKQLKNYDKNAENSPHAWRWRISNEYVAACLLLKSGRRDDARKSFERCASMDPRKFSPLLATKTIASCFQAGMMLAADGDDDAARTMWRQGIDSARQALDGDWTNIVGDFDNPLAFGLTEACEVLDAATRCSWALIEHQQGEGRTGYAWEASLNRNPLRLVHWLKDLNQAKDWHESQHANWRKLAVDRERDVKHWSDAAESLRTGKEWLEAERGRLFRHGRESDQTIKELQSWIDEQESGKQWLDDQRQKLLKAVGKRDQTIEELRTWIESQSQTQVENSERQAATIGQMHARIEELTAWATEQESGRAWLEEQRLKLIEANTSGEEQIKELRGWIATLEENNRLSESQRSDALTKIGNLNASLSQSKDRCAALEASKTQRESQLKNLRDAHALLTTDHYELVDGLVEASAHRLGVRKRVRELIELVARTSPDETNPEFNGQDHRPPNEMAESEVEHSTMSPETSEEKPR